MSELWLKTASLSRLLMPSLRGVIQMSDFVLRQTKSRGHG